MAKVSKDKYKKNVHDLSKKIKAFRLEKEKQLKKIYMAIGLKFNDLLVKDLKSIFTKKKPTPKTKTINKLKLIKNIHMHGTRSLQFNAKTTRLAAVNDFKATVAVEHVECLRPVLRLLLLHENTGMESGGDYRTVYERP